MTDESIPPVRKAFPIFKTLLWSIAVLLLGLGAWAFLEYKAQHPKIEIIRDTLLPSVFQPLPLGSIKPTGWLLEQLKLQAGGLSGHLDEFWPDVEKSGWIGGKAEGWERGPYWLDGVIPLAYEIDDGRSPRAGIERHKRYITKEQTIASRVQVMEVSGHRTRAIPTAPAAAASKPQPTISGTWAHPALSDPVGVLPEHP